MSIYILLIMMLLAHCYEEPIMQFNQTYYNYTTNQPTKISILFVNKQNYNITNISIAPTAQSQLIGIISPDSYIGPPTTVTFTITPNATSNFGLEFVFKYDITSLVNGKPIIIKHSRNIGTKFVYSLPYEKNLLCEEVIMGISPNRTLIHSGVWNCSNGMNCNYSSNVPTAEFLLLEYGIDNGTCLINLNRGGVLTIGGTNSTKYQFSNKGKSVAYYSDDYGMANEMFYTNVSIKIKGQIIWCEVLLDESSFCVYDRIVESCVIVATERNTIGYIVVIPFLIFMVIVITWLYFTSSKEDSSSKTVKPTSKPSYVELQEMQAHPKSNN